MTIEKSLMRIAEALEELLTMGRPSGKNLEEDPALPRFVTKSYILESGRYVITKGQLDAWMMGRHKNGLFKAVKKQSKRLTIDRVLFDRWLSTDHIGVL